MTTMGRRGFLFSFDLVIAFIAVLAMFYLILLNYSAFAEGAAQAGRDYALQKNALFLLDGIVKNSSAGNPMLGAAKFDAEKRRALSNELDLVKAGNFRQIENTEFRVREISLHFKDGAVETLFEENAGGGDCVSLDRFVLAGGRKALLRAVVCDAQGDLPFG